MKKGIGILVLIVALGAMVYFYPFRKSSSGNINMILPETSLFTVRISNTNELTSLLEKQPWFEAIKKMPLASLILSQASALDSLQEFGNLKSKLSALEVWVSMHTTSSDELSPLFIIKSDGFDWELSSLETVISALAGSSLAIESQTFNGKEISLIKSSSLSIASLIEGPYLIIAENALLVEDVVRATQEEDKRLLVESDVLKEGSLMSLILNADRLGELGSVFFQEINDNIYGFQIEGNIIVDVDVREKELVFRGARYGQDELTPEPAEIFGKNFIPVISSSFYWSPNEVSQKELMDVLDNGVGTISISQALNQEQVYIFSVRDTTEASRILTAAANEKLTQRDSAVYNERFITSSIGYVNDSKYLSQLINGFPQEASAPFYALFQEMLVVSDNLDALKTVLNDFDAEATWGRSIERRRILDDMIQETDLTYVQDFEYAADPLKRSLKPKWRTFFSDNPELIDVLELFKVQLNKTSNSVLVSGNLALRDNFMSPVKANANEEVKNDISANVFADASIRTKPFVVKNHNNSSYEVMFQDAQNSLYLTNMQGEVLWKKELTGSLRGDVHQIDFYKNRKLQYLLFADSLIYLVDRNGNDVDGFPKTAESINTLVGTGIIDYDNNKNYRYLAVERRGDISLYNKEGEVLEGWNPKKLSGPLLQTPFHVRIRGRDCFVAVETSGNIHLLNRKGESYEGFPVKIDGRFAGNVGLERGADFSQTLISVMTEEGEFVKVNFDGRVVTQKQFLRPSINTTFDLVHDALKTNFNIVRNNGRVLTFFDNQLNETFSVDYPNSRNVSVDFYNFRNGKEVYVLRDVDENIMRIVDKNGQFLTPVIPNNERVSILFYQNRLEYEVFVNFANQMNIYVVKPL